MVAILNASPERQRMYLPVGMAIGTEYHADVTADARGSTVGASAITRFDFDWGDGQITTRTVAAFGVDAGLATHQYVFNHIGVYQCGLGGKTIKVTVTNSLGATSVASTLIYNLSDHMRFGIWSESATNEDTYETFFGRGLSAMKINHNYADAPRAPNAQEQESIDDVQSAQYPRRHRISQKNLKSASDQGGGGEPGPVGIKAYNITWHHIHQNLRCQAITSASRGVWPAWPPAGTYKNVNGVDVVFSSAAGNLAQLTPSVYFIDMWRRYKEWNEPFYYELEGEAERCLPIQADYWVDPAREGFDATISPVVNEVDWQQAQDQIIAWKEQVVVPNLVGFIIDLFTNTVIDNAFGGPSNWYDRLTGTWHFVSMSYYNRWNRTGSLTWRTAERGAGYLLRESRRMNKPMFYDEWATRADDLLENINNVVNVSGNRWTLTAAGTGTRLASTRAVVGEDVRLTGFTPASWNGDFNVLATSGATFDINTGVATPPTVQGQVQYIGRRADWWRKCRQVFKGQIDTELGTRVGPLELEGFTVNSAHAGADGPYSWLASDIGGDVQTQEAIRAMLGDPAFSAGFTQAPPEEPPPSGLYESAAVPYDAAGVQYGGNLGPMVMLPTLAASAVASGEVSSLLGLVNFVMIVDSPGEALAEGVPASLGQAPIVIVAPTAAEATAEGITSQTLMTSPPIPLELLPPVVVAVQGPAATRTLNSPTGSVIGNLTWSSVINGGFSELSGEISLAEFSSNPTVYKYGSIVTASIIAGQGYVDEGRILFSGYLRTPVPTESGSVQLVAVGWKTLLEEREEPMLWQDRFFGSWMDTDNDDIWGGSFRSDDSIDTTVRSSSLLWVAKKGTSLKTADAGRIGWYYQSDSGDPLRDHRIRRIAGRVRQNIDMPGGAVAPGSNYRMRIMRYDGPTNFASGQNVYSLESELSQANNSQFDVVVGVPRNTITIELDYRDANKDITNTFRVWIVNLKVNGDAYRATPPSWDLYTSSDVAADLAFWMGFSTRIIGTVTNILPLWWVTGSWAELMDYLCFGGGDVQGVFRWAVWEADGTGKPVLEFSPWGQGSNRSWTVYGYSESAHTIATIAPGDDIYNRVEVAYKQAGSARIRNILKPVTIAGQDPFAGLPAPLPLRKRTFKISLPDPVHDDTFPNAVADTAVNELSQEQFSGTITFSHVFDGALTRPSYVVKAGDQLMVADFPPGPKMLRIYEVQHSETESVATVGETPMRLERLMWWHQKQRQRKGRIASTPS